MPDFKPNVISTPYAKMSTEPQGEGATLNVGIFQTDLLVTACLQAGLADLRANPHLIDYIFAWLPQDPATYKAYGMASLQKAKDWFLNNNIQVTLAYKPLDPAEQPVVEVELLEEAEDSNTLGDINYETQEFVQSETLVTVLGPTQGVYYGNTGVLLVPNANNLAISTDLYVRDDKGILHPIYDVSQANGKLSLTLDTGIQASFNNVYIVPKSQNTIVTLESCLCRQKVGINLYSIGTPEHMSYFHSIIKFILYRYRQNYLEGRGFERSSFTSGDLQRSQEMEKEVVYRRIIQLTGFVRNSWPKYIGQPVLAADLQLINIDAGKTPGDPDLDDLSWINEGDIEPF